MLSLGVPIERIVLLGTRTDVVGKWSGNTNPEEKLVKLQWMAKILDIERELFFNLMMDLSNDISNLQKTSRSIAFLDCVLSFSTLALSSNLQKPEIANDKIIDIKKGKH